MPTTPLETHTTFNVARREEGKEGAGGDCDSLGRLPLDFTSARRGRPSTSLARRVQTRSERGWAVPAGREALRVTKARPPRRTAVRTTRGKTRQDKAGSADSSPRTDWAEQQRAYGSRIGRPRRLVGLLYPQAESQDRAPLTRPRTAHILSAGPSNANCERTQLEAHR